MFARLRGIAPGRACRFGRVEQLFDVSFDVGHQLSYETPAVLHAGDSITTTCRYRNSTDHTVFNGYNSGDEMCSNFVYAWPAGTLANATIGGVESCDF